MEEFDESLFEDKPYDAAEVDDTLFEDKPYEAAAEEDLSDVSQTISANLAQGMSFGLSDEIAGGVEALGSAVGVSGLGGPLRDIGLAEEGPQIGPQQLLEAYRRGRDVERGILQKTQEDRPKLATGLDVAGGFVTPIPGLGALTKTGKGLSAGAKALARTGGEAVETGTRMLPGAGVRALPGQALAEAGEAGIKQAAVGAAKTGAKAGALEGFGRTESEDPMDLLFGTGMGLGLGGLLGAGTGALGKKFSKEALEEVVEQAPRDANIAALKGIGAGPSDIATELGTKTSKKATAGTAKGAGQTLLDEDLIKLRQTPEKVKEAIVEKMDEVVTERMNPVVQKLDEKVREFTQKQLVEPLDNFVNSTRRTMENTVGATTYAEDASGAVYKNMVNTSKSVYDDVIDALKSPDKFNRLKEIKQTLGKEINFKDPNASTYNKFLLDTQANVSRLMNDLAKKADPELGQQMINANKTYSNLIRANEIAGRELARTLARTDGIGWKDYLTAGIVSGIGGNRMLGPAAVAAKRGIEKFTGKGTGKMMNTMEAFYKQRAGQRANKALQELPDSPFKMAMQGQSGNVAQAATASGAAMLDDTNVSEPYKRDRRAADYVKRANPEELIQQAERIKTKYGKQGDRLANTLGKIAERDKTGRDALIFSLLQDPENRRMLGLIDEE